MSDGISNKKFIIIFLSSFLILSLSIVPNFLFLRNVGEFLSAQEIYTVQNSKKATETIYGSGLFNGVNELKIYSFKNKNPKIISLGSSRVLQFRESFFKYNFYNMGYIASSVNELKEFIYNYNLDGLECIILGIDFWWFQNKSQHTRFKRKEGALTVPFQPNTIMPHHLVMPFKWLLNNQLTYSDFKKYLFKKSNNIGLRATLTNSGFAADGSVYYTDIVSGQSTSFNDQRFASTINLVKKSQNRFEHGSTFSQEAFNDLIKIISFLNKKKIKVIMFFPPLASRVNEEMLKYDFSYIENLKNAFKAHNLFVYNFTEAKNFVETSDCEFIDGFHGGDVLYAKILYFLAKNNILLSCYVNIDYLEKIIKQYNGLSMIPNKKICLQPEVDFLQLGCKKFSHHRAAK